MHISKANNLLQSLVLSKAKKLYQKNGKKVRNGAFISEYKRYKQKKEGGKVGERTSRRLSDDTMKRTKYLPPFNKDIKRKENKQNQAQQKYWYSKDNGRILISISQILDNVVRIGKVLNHIGAMFVPSFLNAFRKIRCAIHGPEGTSICFYRYSTRRFTDDVNRCPTAR